MTQQQRATEFAVFCIENTAAQIGCNGIDIFRELQRTNGIANFLFPSYPTLHTQSKAYIIDEVIQYISQNNPNFTKSITK